VNGAGVREDGRLDALLPYVARRLAVKRLGGAFPHTTSSSKLFYFWSWLSDSRNGGSRVLRQLVINCSAAVQQSSKRACSHLDKFIGVESNLFGSENEKVDISVNLPVPKLSAVPKILVVRDSSVQCWTLISWAQLTASGQARYRQLTVNNEGLTFALSSSLSTLGLYLFVQYCSGCMWSPSQRSWTV